MGWLAAWQTFVIFLGSDGYESREMRPSLGVLPLIAAVAAGLRGLVASSVPCYDCEMYNIDNKDRPQSDASYNDAVSLYLMLDIYIYIYI